MPGALGPTGVELPSSTKLHVLPLSLTAVRGLWQSRGTVQPPSCEVGWPWPGGPSCSVGPNTWPWCPVSFHSAFSHPRNSRGPGWVTGAGPSLSRASVSPLLSGVPQGGCSMEWGALCPFSGVRGDFSIIYGLPLGSGSCWTCVPMTGWG